MKISTNPGRLRGNQSQTISVSIRGKLPVNFQRTIDNIAQQHRELKVVHASFSVPACCDILVLSGDLDSVRAAMKTYVSRYQRPPAVFWALYSSALSDNHSLSPEELPDLLAYASTPLVQFELMFRQLVRQAQASTMPDIDDYAAGSRDLSSRKRQFLMLANHELRTPATIISGALDLLTDQKHRLPEQMRKMIDCAQKGSDRLNRILEDISYLIQESHVSRNREEPLRSLSLMVLLERVRQFYTSALQDRNIVLTTGVGEKDRVLGCPDRLFTLFSHLVSNAIKNSPDGATIDITSSVNGNQVCIRVIDHGRGLGLISDKDLFEPFCNDGEIRFHHSSNVADGGGGPGLGLPVCRKIVEQHRGSIIVKSNAAGPGVTVTVFLPSPQQDDLSTPFLRQLLTESVID